MQRVLSVVAILAVFALLVFGVFAIFNPHTPPPAPKPQWGAYAGEATDVSALEASVGAPMDIVATFVGFDEAFPSEFASSSMGSSTQKTLLVFWEPSTGYDDVIAGTFDTQIQAFAAAAKSYGQPVILVPFEEPNLNEEVWGFSQGDNTPLKFIKAWQHVHDYFADAPNVKFAFDINNISVPNEPDNSAASFYPGDAYVDYVGVDGFNMLNDGDQWQTPEQVFGPALASLAPFNKPVYIFSVSSAEDPRKAQWTTDFFSWLKANPQIKGFVWFNTNKERDWRVDSDPASLSAFQQGLKQL